MSTDGQAVRSRFTTRLMIDRTSLPVGRLPGTQDAGDQFAASAFEDEQRHVAVGIMIGIEQAQLLRSVRGIIGIIDIQDDRVRWRIV